MQKPSNELAMTAVSIIALVVIVALLIASKGNLDIFFDIKVSKRLIQY